MITDLPLVNQAQTAVVGTPHIHLLVDPVFFNEGEELDVLLIPSLRF